MNESSMKKFNWLNQISSNGKKLERRLSFGELKRAISWSKYLVSNGGEIKGEGEEAWSAEMSQLYVGTKFAMGRHSRIYKGLYKQNHVAVKLISQPREDADLAAMLEKQFVSEVTLLFRLHHPNVITLFAACKNTPVFCIITEYCAGGSLRKYLHQQKPYSLPLTLILKLAIDIARGMQYLHSQGILHRDLKSENLFLGKDMTVKVADFGISCLESQCGSGKGFTGTYRWMAPEMIKEKRHTKKVDVYSFGIVLWELFTALTPFDNMTPEQAAFAVSQKEDLSARLVPKTGHSAPCNITAASRQAWDQFFPLLNSCSEDGIVVCNARPPLPSTCPMAFRHLISQCWSSNPNKRPSFDEILTILESYAEFLKQDPEFFSSYEPPECHTRSWCWPRCISILTSAS